ncbi:uncharacterized protein LOC110706456 [Chenopodium quinoa]|uniref:uncharacterized protein LOC110706456 n=1 Tax=Chenopodium quinoa TaxID=63459 RepID=UPI000B784052|nr:uncharacterized protein LOC110706456 [Chenopodium quinoa]
MDGLLRAAFRVNTRQTSKTQDPSFNEQSIEDDNSYDMDEGFTIYREVDDEYQSTFSNEEHAKYKNLMEAFEKGLYEGCTTFSKLSFLLHLFHLKCMFHWSAESFNKLLELLIDAFPIIKEFPLSYYEGMKIINDLGLGYEKIHACPNDCMLYWGKFANKSECHIFKTSRWKNVKGNEGDVNEKGKEACKKGEAAKKKFDEKYTEFATDPRSVRLGLASDGFNPYRLMNTNYSTWPVDLIPYNLPPWLCMKPSSFILSIIILGKFGPGMDIDVYLQPLIHELKLLWEGVDAFDSYSESNFKLRAALHSTFNDFPAYAMLSDRFGGKIIYTGYRKWLPIDHPYRSQANFLNGKEEYGIALIRTSGTDVLKQQEGVKYVYGKTKKVPKKREKKAANELDDDCDPDGDHILWKKKRTLLDMDNSRDDESGREALKNLNIKTHLWIDPQGYIPQAAYTMSNEEKERFLKVLKKMKVPDGYGSNLQRCVNLKQQKLINMKSHDHHILIYKRIRYHSIKARGDSLHCNFEKEFLPTFFTIMVHLLIHLVEEVRLGGPVHYRWMYPIERYLAFLKSHVSNKAQPEGSIVEGYLLWETIAFCSRYLESVKTMFNRPRRNEDGVSNIDNYLYNSGGRVVGKKENVRLDDRSLKQAHRYVLLHSDELTPVLNEFLKLKRLENDVGGSQVDESIENRWIIDEFANWLQSQVHNLDDSTVDGKLRKTLVGGLSNRGKRMKSVIINGYKFDIVDRERFRVTQNSGIMVEAEGHEYYGKLNEILELDYYELKFKSEFSSGFLIAALNIRNEFYNRNSNLNSVVDFSFDFSSKHQK